MYICVFIIYLDVIEAPLANHLPFFVVKRKAMAMFEPTITLWCLDCTIIRSCFSSFPRILTLALPNSRDDRPAVLYCCCLLRVKWSACLSFDFSLSSLNHCAVHVNVSKSSTSLGKHAFQYIYIYIIDKDIYLSIYDYMWIKVSHANHMPSIGMWPEALVIFCYTSPCPIFARATGDWQGSQTVHIMASAWHRQLYGHGRVHKRNSLPGDMKPSLILVSYLQLIMTSIHIQWEDPARL